MAELVDYNNNDIGFHYSTEEQWTGKYWIDGKKIYTKTYYTQTNSKKEIDILHGISNIGVYKTFDTCNSFWVDTKRTNSYSMNVYIDNVSWESTYSIDDTYIKVRFGDNFVYNWDMYITIRYTKNE